MLQTADQAMNDNGQPPVDGDVTSVTSNSSNNNNSNKTSRRVLVMTLFSACVVFCMGMQIGQKGPSFLDLELISGTDTEGVSSYFTAYSFGYMVGTIGAGFLYDKLSNVYLLVCIPLTLAAVLIGLIPWCTSYVSMLLIHLIAAMVCAVPDTTITADVLRMWHGKSDSVVHVISFSYSLGGVLGPLYTEPFLAPVYFTNGTDTPHRQNNESVMVEVRNNTESSSYTPQSVFVNQSNIDIGYHGNQSIPSLTYSKPEESGLIYAYLITGIFAVLVAIPFYVVSVRHCFQRTAAEKKTLEKVVSPRKRLTLKPYVLLTLVVSAFVFIYTMAEDSFNLFLPMFVVSHLSWSKEAGALLTSLYWGTSTVAKLILVFLATRVDTGRILLVSCLGMVLSLVLFLVASQSHSHILVWVSSSCFALTQASLFGGMFAWADSNLLKLDGKAASTAMLFNALGSMSGPLALGITMEQFSFISFAYIVLILGVINMLLFLFMLFILKPFVIRKYGPTRPSNSLDIDVDGTGEEKEMVSNLDLNEDAIANDREDDKLAIKPLKM